MFLVLLALVAQAELPLAAWPDCAEDRPDLCPNDLNGWDVISWVPEGSRESVRPAEREAGSGVALDRALAYGSGRFDVAIAVLDSGIKWEESQVVRKVQLNTGELPPAQRADGAEVPGGDLDGNGLINVDDYAEDPRVAWDAGVDATDDRLDPSDLIATFSDGIDDDGNGWVDDIAGWDFYDDDNDPYAVRDGEFGDHGTGVMKTAAAAGNDGGDIGTCPNCSILPLRIGDSFVTTGDRITQALGYARQRRARVAAMAIGSLSMPASLRAEVEAAEAAGMVLVGAAGDENSWHRNLPAAASPFLFVHSVRGDNMDENDGTYSYLNIWNCNNWGPRLDLVAPNNACATGAVGMIAGGAGLLISQGLERGLDLSAPEVRSLLQQTAYDVALSPEEQDEAGQYPSQPGWDAFYGYGRMDLGRASATLAEGALPPVARLVTPDWGVALARAQGSLALEGVVAAPRSEVDKWQIEAGLGAEPAEWEVVADGRGAAEGLLGTVDLTTFRWPKPGDLSPALGVVDRMVRAHEPMLTLRLSVTDVEGRRAEHRVGAFLSDDPDLLAGFPRSFPSSLESSPVLIPADAEPGFEILLAETNGTLHLLGADGVDLPGWPVQTRPLPLAEREPWASEGGVVHEGILGTPAAGDLDGDGTWEVVAATTSGGVYAWTLDGQPLSGFPVDIVGRTAEERSVERVFETGVFGSPALGDVDGDGGLEIVVAGMDQRLYVWGADGQLRPGYPIELCGDCTQGARIIASPALGDLDADGDLDVVVGTGEVPPGAEGMLFAVDLSTAAVLPGWPLPRPGLIGEVLLPLIGEGHPSSVALADLDGDGDLEIASNAMLGNAPPIHHDGQPVYTVTFNADGYGPESNVSEGGFRTMITNPAFGDLDGDRVPDLVQGGSGALWLVSLALPNVVEFQHAVGAWSGRDGSVLTGWPRQVDDVSFLHAPAIADVSGDGRPEVIYASGGHYVYAWDAEGRLAPGFPRFTGGWSIGTAAVGDVDGDGWLEVVVGTREGQLFAWSTPGRADQAVQWPSFRHDPANTGNLLTPLPLQDGPAATGDEAEGCCRRGDRSAAWAPLLLLALAWRRRRCG